MISVRLLAVSFQSLCFKMTKLSLVVCKIIDHSSEDVFCRPFVQVREIGGVKLQTLTFSVMQRNKEDQFRSLRTNNTNI